MWAYRDGGQRRDLRDRRRRRVIINQTAPRVVIILKNDTELKNEKYSGISKTAVAPNYYPYNLRFSSTNINGENS